MEKNVSKREQITLVIEDFIGKFVTDDEIILSVADIRKWPIVDSLCENHDSANICKAMKLVKYGKCYIDGIEDSSSFKMLFTRKVQNIQTEDFFSKTEMENAITKTGWKYVLRVKEKAHIHFAGCAYLWKNSPIKTGNSSYHYDIYPTKEIALANAARKRKVGKIKNCPYCGL